MFELCAQLDAERGVAYSEPDFITIGRCSYYGDTTRMRAELLPELKYPILSTGKHTL